LATSLGQPASITGGVLSPRQPKPNPTPRWKLAEMSLMGNHEPPSVEEIEEAHNALRKFALERFKTFKKAFHMLDADKSGTVSRKEFMKILTLSNLPLREVTLKALADIYDKNGNGLIDYEEFNTAFESEEAFNNAAASDGVRAKKHSSHVDHALEMWRSGHATGGNRHDTRYRFDGKVDMVGEGDEMPVSVEEVERAHDQIRDYACTRWSSLSKAFNNLDEDRSGKVTKLEFLRILMLANLPIREKTMSMLADVYDTNHNGQIDYKEFSLAMSKGDAIDVRAALPNLDTHKPRSRYNRHVFVPGQGVMYDQREAKPMEVHHIQFDPDAPKYEHVDQALEMWREGQAAGELRVYDGTVNKIGHGDHGAPPTKEEMEKAHDQLRNYAATRWDTFRDAFRAIDEDGSGKLSKMEFMRILMMANLQIREKTIAALVEVYDKNKNGEIDYNEFCEHFLNKDNAY